MTDTKSTVTTCRLRLEWAAQQVNTRQHSKRSARAALSYDGCLRSWHARLALRSASYLDLLAEGHIAFQDALLDSLFAAQRLASISCCRLRSASSPAPSATSARLGLPSGLPLYLLLHHERQGAVRQRGGKAACATDLNRSDAWCACFTRNAYLRRGVCCRCSNLCLPLAKGFQRLLEVLCHVLPSSHGNVAVEKHHSPHEVAADPQIT